jgi:hypothetical protein
MYKQICPKRALELQVHFCINFNTNSYTNLSTERSDLAFERIGFVPISIQSHKQICPQMALELRVHFCINWNGSGAPGPFLYQFQYKFIC